MKSHALPVMILSLLTLSTLAQDWKPKQAPIMTRWAKDVSPDKVHPEYPRPQMRRDKWQNLNGLWDYAIQPRNNAQPSAWQGKILVPFPAESALSGVMQPVGKDNRLWYRRTFEIPADWKDQRILLHFGAVDWDTTVLVNGKEVGKHVGGYDQFSFDITDSIKRNEFNEIILSVFDPTTDGTQPIGKQHARPHGIWYTPTTGIWQTVWIEPVHHDSIADFRITPDIDKGELRVTVQTRGNVDSIEVSALEGSTQIARAQGKPSQELTLKFGSAKLWSPDTPHLYDLKIVSRGQKDAVDTVQSYFAMRKISLGKDKDGITRLMLNNQFVFQFGPLDQGFWPDGLYTAPTDEALKYDLEMTKKLGFNMVRKHVKVEPLRWYHHCDKLGLLVWQDMPSGEKHVRPNQGEITRSPESAQVFERELKAMMDALYNAPSIVMWVPFNEGWGQYDTVRITNWVKQHDPSRLAICASGWNDYPAGDAHDIHSYPGPSSPRPEENRAAVLGEFGGLGLPLEGHTWQARGNWGYRSFTERAPLQDAYLALISRLRLLIGNPGLSAAVYTQTTDVEIEVNGLMTYDRQVLKFDADTIRKAHDKLHLPPPKLTVLVPNAQSDPIEWQCTTTDPGQGWHSAEFNASSWQKAPAGFGTSGTPGTTVRTQWNTPNIWIRRTFELKEVPQEIQLSIHHDEDAQVYINGILAASLTGYTTNYTTVPISPAAQKALRPGANVLAIHCKQTTGGQYIDAGVVQITEQK